MFAGGDFEAIYEEYFTLLVGTAISKFGVPEMDAQTLAQEVFFDFLRKGGRIEDPKGWLLGGICNASRYFLRRRARSEALPETYAEEPDPHLARVRFMWPDQLAGREAFRCTTARCQLVLSLRYFLGYSVPEIARQLGITKKYASKLVSECLRQAQRRYTKKETTCGART